MNELKNDFPIIKTFIHEDKCYVYDAYTNQLFNVSTEQFIEICELQNIGLNKYKNLRKSNNSYHDIIIMIDKGYFRNQFIDKVEHPDTKYIAHLVNRCMNHLVIEVTSACNFKCRYCHQAGNIDLVPKKMSESIAFRSVDFLYEHSKDAYEVIITFYGGEPLLNFELIKATVMYSKNKFKSKPVSFNMTTNGSILNDDIINFLIENDFSLLISLDGNEETQNQHRKYLQDGGLTFNVVWNNVKRIKDNYPSYFNSNVRFNSVVLQDEPSENVFSFFESNGILRSMVNIRSADLNGIDYTYSLISFSEKQSIAEKFEDKFINILKSFNNKNRITKEWHHNGPCVPVARRLFVNADGNFFPCEKIDSESSCFLGDLDSGINIEKAVQILNIGKLTDQDCIKCWALRFCTICVMQCIDEGLWLRDKKLITCNRHKEEAMYFLKEYITHKKTKG